MALPVLEVQAWAVKCNEQCGMRAQVKPWSIKASFKTDFGLCHFTRRLEEIGHVPRVPQKESDGCNYSPLVAQAQGKLTLIGLRGSGIPIAEALPEQ